MNKKELSKYIKAEALRLGFDVCGIAKATSVHIDTVEFINKWLTEEKNGSMSYLERNRDKRYNPTQLTEECKSIVVVAMSYAPAEPIEGLSDYALGRDYHKAVKDRLFALMNSINLITPCKGRAFCDSAPVLERYWAVEAGIGWIGKNHQLIIPGKGSKFFIGELLIDIEIEYDKPYTGNHCGNCKKCIDNCPTAALSSKGFDARRCLSYLTIEHRGELPENIGEKMKKNFYGCDCCQETCPHNRFSVPNNIPELQPSPELQRMQREDWENLTLKQYEALFAHSAVERCGYEQLMRNINALKSKKGLR